ncbi:UvrD-helicase domain-containing protein [Eoetvoesiella caeni]|uniref:DNA 3'-5' helicase n=1 Tax=Eoetvoesiella caeni TaxID=645616 RepID=A0A366HG64_9BURK|nr:UvrD-helicase domain-containing protein [Eoetvoesiella caeni]MCI2808619.1 UvrD-helicase domain-containing protein [Eoetvoesiella caeni]NYT55160.1 UvrD-helicase domain-containing protein [Eoetvoesiella caeni]RBP40859.1 ATP-dependent DNA helicase UvrD [Eoetvoesiella caeni]
MIDQLNPEQQAAVTLPPQHALVLAGAGSGKTRVLTTRMAWLIQTSQASPFGLLAVTFTNKSAREMLTRLSALLPINTRGMWVGTFHGLCNRMLRAHHRDAGLLQTFQILDSADQLAAIKRLIKGAGIDDEKYPPRDVQRFINGAKEEGLRPGSVDAWDAHRRRLVEIYQMYQDQCEREGVVDFAELLLRAYELLQRNAPIREHYQRRFQHILVDEFQDTNTLQYQWLKLLAGEGASIFAVGDDDQSIYAFRGANVGNMAEFERDYAHGTVIRLEQNYRSYGHILDSANALIAHNTGRLGKNLWTEQGEGEPVRVVEQPSDLLEAHWLVDEIKAVIGEGSLRSEIAVLYRSNAQSRVIEHALFSSRIPYKVYGGLRFFERQEVKHALAYLRLMDNLHDDTSWLRVVNFPTRGIGARTLEQLSDLARQNNTSLYKAVPLMSGKGGGNLLKFTELIQQMAYEAQILSLPELVEHVIHHSGLRTFYQGEKEGADRLENLQELVNAATVFAAEENFDGLPAGRILMPDAPLAAEDPAQPPAADSAEDAATDADVFSPVVQMSPLGAFLSHASLEAGDNQAQAGQDAIQLMTVHAAKGLEFDTVFITGVEEGLFPHENSLIEAAGLEEERRLMYVAITRARQRLYLTLAQSRMLHGQTRYAMRSRFLDEIPEEHLKWLTPRERAPVVANSNWSAGAYRRGDAYGRPSTGGAVARPARSLTTGVSVGDKHFRIGQGVTHAKFGEGTIIGLSGAGVDAQAQIQFRDVGTKTLALGIAKLEIAG